MGLFVVVVVLMGFLVVFIVLIVKVQVFGLCDEIVSGFVEVGVMLLFNLLQYLFLQGLVCFIVMIFGNFSGCLLMLSNVQVFNELVDIVDGFFLYNCDIVQWMDDLLVCLSGEMLCCVWGYVLDVLLLLSGLGDILLLLVFGVDMKNIFCLVCGSEVVLSQYFGDFGEEGVEQQWCSVLQLMQSIYVFVLQWVVVDVYFGYCLMQWVVFLFLLLEIVLYYYVYVVVCLVEYCWLFDGGDVIVLIFDGIGMGENGVLWGGECLWVNYCECEYFGGLLVVVLSGGDLVVCQLW